MPGPSDKVLFSGKHGDNLKLKSYNTQKHECNFLQNSFTQNKGAHIILKVVPLIIILVYPGILLGATFCLIYSGYINCLLSGKTPV